LSDSQFTDYYELLQVSPNADAGTIDRVFRHLAKRYHPDNPQTGDADHFHLLMDAHRTLTDAEKRAAYDSRYQQGVARQWSLIEEAAGYGSDEGDQVLRERLLALLYVQRRRDVMNPSMGHIQLEKLLACPAEHLEFHIWYLKEKKYVERTDQGFAITADGIDYAEQSRALITADRLIPETAGPDAGPEAIASCARPDPREQG
jgi:curved DNA-binding protein CbpA